MHVMLKDKTRFLAGIVRTVYRAAVSYVQVGKLLVERPCVL